MASPGVDSGDTAWLLVSAALVLSMIPSLAMFYGGMVNNKMVVATMLMSFAALAVSALLWSLLSFSLAFGPNASAAADPYIGGLSLGLFDSADRVYPGTLVPEHAYMAFQLAFAGITAAVVSGSVVGRVTTAAWCLFVVFWQLLVYVPLARWVFYPGGWLAKLGVLDFAGGLVVEANSGVSGFVLAALVGAHQRWLDRRAEAHASGAAAKLLRGGGHEHHPSDEDVEAGLGLVQGQGQGNGAQQPPHAAHAHSQGHAKPHDVTYVLLGAGLLLFGWLGFNAGSAIEAKFVASRSFVNTILAAAAGMAGFGCTEVAMNGERPLRGRPTAVGAATGVVVGLVAITPACGYVSQMASLAIGFVAAALAYFAEHGVKHYVPGVQDTLNCFAGHGLGGMVGIIAVGLAASTGEDSPSDGLFVGGGGHLLGVQLLGVVVTIATATAGTTVSWLLTAALLRLLRVEALVPPHASPDDHLHGEAAYDATPIVAAALAAAAAAGDSGATAGGGHANAPSSGEAEAAVRIAMTNAILTALRKELGLSASRHASFALPSLAGSGGGDASPRLRFPSLGGGAASSPRASLLASGSSGGGLRLQ